MSRVFIGTALALALAGSALAQGAGLSFRPVRSPEGKFTAEMPGVPRETTEDRPGGAKERSFAVPVSLTRVFRVTVLELPLSAVRGKDAHRILEAFRDGFRKGRQIE